MRIRSDATVICAALALTVAACAPAEDGEKPATEEDTAAAQEAAAQLAPWAPKMANCSTVVDYLEEYGQDYASAPDTGAVRIRLHRDTAGHLTATPLKVVVRRGQAVQWYSDSLRWTVRFVANASPLPPIKGGIRGAADGKAAPAGKRAVVPADASCGRYHYVAAAVDPATDSLFVLDPPLMISN